MITCSINNIEIVKALYSDVSGALKKAQDSKKEFDHMDYMKKLFKDLSEQGSPEVAAKYLQSVPKIIIDAQNNYFDELKIDLNALSGLNIKFKNLDTGATAVIKELSDVSDLQSKKDDIENDKKDKRDLNENPEAPNPAVKLAERFRTLSPFGGTSQVFVKVDPNKQNPFIQPLAINQELMYMIRTFDRIKEIQNTTNILDGVVYDGTKLMFRALTLSDYNTPENQKYLDKDTRDLIAKSASIIKGKTAPKDVVQITELPILLLSDETGNVLYFDNDGNLTTDELGKPVYQFMRTVRKEGNNFSVTNKYNTEDLLITPEEFAKSTYDPNIDGTEKEYLDSVKEMMKKEMSDLYDIQQKIIFGQEMVLPITGITNGIPSNLSSATIYLNELLQLPNLNSDPNNILKSIDTIPVAQDDFVAGFAFIKINGEKFPINRPLITDDLAMEIATVLTNPNIPNGIKKEYTDQFLAGLDSGNGTKKYSLVYGKSGNSIYFNLYDGFRSKTSTDKLQLHDSALKKLDQETIEKYKQTIVNYLTKEGLDKNDKRTYIIFNNAALNSGRYMRLNSAGTGFNKNADYFEFLRGTQSEISLTNANPGFYNYVVNFTAPNSLLGKAIATKGIEEAQLIDTEIDRIISAATSEEYKATVEQANPFDSFLVTKYLNEQIKDVYSKTQSKEFVQGILSALQGRQYKYLNIGLKQIKLIQDRINSTNFKTGSVVVKPTLEQEIQDIIIVPGAESPENNTPINDVFNEKPSKRAERDDSAFFDRAGIKKEFISPLKIRQAKTWWNSEEMEPMRKLIEFDRMVNIVNSDSYARFIVAGATLADTGIMGKILVNKEKGTVFQNLTIYHESWHVFSQLFLTKQQKLDLYNELKNYKDAKGNTPYANMSLRELEEMLAEDFRNYIKTGKAKQAAPKRNTLFRKMVEFLKQLFGKALNKFKKQDIEINSLNSPMAARLFNELYTGQFNKYSPSIDNQIFNKLDRGPRQVSNPKQDALSPGDGLTLVRSIDNYFAQEIDRLYQSRKEQGQDRKEISLSALISPKQRELLYERAREEFEDILEIEKAKLRAIEGIANFNSLTTLQEIEDNAFAIMKNEVFDEESGELIPSKSGKDKYFFLTSQVSDFKNLAASTKKGERVRGEDYKEAIKIVGDFYKHKTIKKDGRLIDIVLVTRPQDAQTQFDNYKKGKAKSFSKIEIKPIVDEVTIDQEQEVIRDNVRVLETTLRNWGDEKNGIIKYHMENTDFEVSKKKYDVDGEEIIKPDSEDVDKENGEPKDPEENNGGLEGGNEKTGSLSLQQTMNKETIFVLKTLFKVNSNGTIPTDRFGFKERADFSKTFAIVAKTIGGIRDRQQAYEKLREESTKFPELKQLFESKFPNPNKSGANVNTFEFDIARNFFQDFGKPHIDYLQLYAYYEKETNPDGTSADRINFTVKESDLAIDNLLSKWSNNFTTLKKSNYINVSKDNIRTLKLSEIVKDFKSGKADELEIDKQLDFAKVLGIELQNNDNIKNALAGSGSSYYGLPYMFQVLNSINNLEQSTIDKPLTNDEEALVRKFKENPVKVLMDGFPGSLIKKAGVIKQNTQLKRLAELQTTYGYDSSSTAIIRSNQNVGYKEVNWSSGHAKAFALNEVEEMQQLWNDPRYNYMSNLNPDINTHTRHLKILSSLFTEDGKKKKNANVRFFAQDGFAVTDIAGNNSGNTTTELDPLSKFIFEFHTMSLSGVAELPRTSEKKFSYGFKVEGGIDHPDVNFQSAKDSNLYIDIDMFLSPKGEQYARAGYLYGYIQGEFDRIKKFRGPEKDKYLTITGYNEPIMEDGKKLFSGETFVAFKGMLSKETKAKLYALADQQADIEILDYVQQVDQELGKMIKDDITLFFNEKAQELKKLYYDKIPFLSRSLLEKVGIKKDSIKDDEEYRKYFQDPKIVNALLKSYTYNDFIHKYETSMIMFGDHAQWNHGKEDWSKRIPGLTSDGIGFMFDNQTQDFINNVFNKETYASKLSAKEGLSYNNMYFSEKMNSAVIADPERRSIYIDDIEPLWRADYEKTFSKEVAKEKAAQDADSYKNMKESDGMAFVTLDMYRTLKKVGRGWSLAEEALYQKIINGETTDSKDVKEFFSIYKLHYFGTIENNLLPVTGMYKFSVMPIIPGVNAIEGNELDKLHKKMLRQNVQLVTFASGSKGAHLTSDGKTDNVFVDKDKKYVNTEVIAEGENEGQDAFQFTKNPIYLANLKEVTVMNNYYKGELQIATQTRAIIIDNLYENGELKNADNKKVVDDYNNTIKDYSELLKEDLLNGLGLELVDGRVVGDFTKFAEIIREELSQRDIPPHLVKLINTNEDGKIAMDLSLHPESDSIEKLLVSLIQRGVIKQKTNGEPLVQSPATFTNGIWDTPYLNLTELKEIQKLLGTNTLPYYLVNGKTRSEEMKVAIALQGDFRNLLKAKDLEGNEIQTIERLNQLLKDPEWFAQNKKAITLYGPRIPNDAHNTIEAVTVWHFLPESYGNTIITPTEIVAKAGSDFDGDKLFMSMPNIDSDGNYIDKGVDDFGKVLEETKKLEKSNKLPEGRMTSKQLINLQKKYLQNKYLQASVEILMLPENAVTVTKPNGTYLMDRYEKDVTDFRTGYDKFKNVGGRPSDVNTKNKAIPNPSTHFTAGYNLYVHDANLSLEPSLGILAKLTKSIPMYKAAGAKMPATYSATSRVIVPLDVRFNKNNTINKDGEVVVSLGGEKNVAGENISDTTSHSLQGVLDRAKATFPFELKLVPKAMDVYGYLTRAGVDQEEIVYLLNQPLVSQYLDLQNINDSSINNALFGSKNKYQISQNLFVENLKKTLSEEQVKKLVRDINTAKLSATLDALDGNLEINVYIPSSPLQETTVSNLREQLNSGTLNPNSISAIQTEKIDEEGNIGYENLYKYITPSFDGAAYLLNKENGYFFIDYIAKNTLKDKNIIDKSDLFTILKKQDSSSLKALMIFAHYLELERQYSRMGDFEKSFSPDTAKVTTVQESIIRRKKYQSFYGSKEIDQEFLNNMMNNSVVSSLIFDDLTIDLLTPLFETKLDNNIVEFIDSAISDRRGEITLKFGRGADGRSQFIREFGNNIVNFIYQNYTSYNYDAKGKLSNLPELFKEREVIIDNNIDVPVLIEDGKVRVNSRIIELDFANKSYLTNNNTEIAYSNRNYDTFTLGQDPFKSLRSFYRYHLDLAYLESNNTVDSLRDDDYFIQLVAKNDGNIDQAYIQYISERALLNSYNPMYIMGKTKYSYTNNVLELLDSLQDYPALFDTFPILTQISPQRNREGFKIIKLNDRSEVKGQLAQDYYTQIRQLADYSIQKLDNPNNSPLITSKDKRISDLFHVFSLMMVYQHGVGKTGTGFNNALDSSQYKAVIMGATEAFMGNYIKSPDTAMSSALLSKILQETLNRQRFKLLIGTKNEFANKDIEALANEFEEKRKDGEIEEFDPEEGATPIPSNFKPGERIILDEDVKSFKKYLIASNGVKPEKFSTITTKFSKFYNGRQQGMPNSAAWILNASTGLYDMVELSQDSDLAGEIYYENVDLETGLQMIKEGEGPTQSGVSQTNKPKGEEVKEGIYVNQGALTKEEQLELFNYLKPFLEEQAAKTLKAANASKMIGLGLRWDYKNNNAGRQAVEIPDVINPGNRTKYGYYNESINGQPLGEITPRFRELMQKATGVDMTNYDGAIINLYEKDTFISSHNDVDESRSAIKYPVIGINLGGKGNFSIERLGTENAMLDLQAGTGYIFGVDGINREVWHRTFPTPQDSFLPDLTTKIDGKTYPAGSYRVTITMRRVMPLTEGIPVAPSIVSTQPTGTPVATTNNPAEFTNHSGGAYGGDTYWDVIGREYGVTKHKHYRDAGNTSLSAQLRKSGVQAEVLTKEQMDKARIEVERLLGKKYPDTTEGNLQVRNYYQVANSDAVFAIAEIEMTTDKSNPNLTDSTKSKYSYFSNKVKGGTNTAVQLGIQLGKPVYVWDLKNQFWTQFDGKDFVKIDTPVLTKNFAGVGSRDIEDYAIPIEKDSTGKVTKWGKTSDTGKYKGLEIEESVKQAIRDVYEKTLTEQIPEPVGPIKDEGTGKDMSNTSLVTDMEEYNRLVTASNGVQPKTFTVGTRTWNLNKFGNYDWSDPTSGQIYMRNVNMETGELILESTMNDPVDPALIEQSLNFIDSTRKLLALDHKFADMGYDINDIIRDLMEAKTMQDYFNVKEKLDKLC